MNLFKKKKVVEQIEENLSGLSKYPINKSMKVRVYTHTDIAGIVCAVLATLCFEDVEIIYCSNNKIDEILSKDIFITREIEKADLTIIADVSIGKGSVVNLQKLIERFGDDINVRYYNHQDINTWMNEYSWARILPEKDNIRLDSAAVMYNELVEEFGFTTDSLVEELVEKSRRYTRWEWEKLDDQNANHLSMLCHNGSRVLFTKNLVSKIKNNEDIINEGDLETCRYIEEEYKEYLKRKKESIILKKIYHNGDMVKIGMVVGELHVAKLAADLAAIYNNIDVIAVIDSLEKIRFRKSNQKDINLSEVARIFGGNGEEFAAGASIPVEVRDVLMDTLLNELSCNNDD